MEYDENISLSQLFYMIEWSNNVKELTELAKLSQANTQLYLLAMKKIEIYSSKSIDNVQLMSGKYLKHRRKFFKNMEQ